MASPEPAPAPEKKPRKRTTREIDNKEDKPIEPGQVLKSQKAVDYLVEKGIGAGGFGQVWKVSLLKEPDKRFAMKTEQNFSPNKNMLRLKCEVNLFNEIERASNRIDKTHFVRMHDKGKTATFKYMIMDLIWLSLQDVKEKICGDVFTPHTMIKVARQSLKSIEALHEIGYLHRDIKPHNFAVGLPPKDSIVYLLDFGIARPYRDKEGGLRKPRKTVKFMGTMLYASMECLCRNEQSRRDDLEVWMYMMIEFYDKANLSWATLESDQAQLHVEYRSDLMQKSKELFAEGKLKVPEKWTDIIELLNGMNYEDPGDFTQINLFLSQICVEENIDENLPLDWVGKKPNSPERPKKEEKKKEKKKEGPLRKKNTVEKKEDNPKDDEKKEFIKRARGSTGGRPIVIHEENEEIMEDMPEKSGSPLSPPLLTMASSTSDFSSTSSYTSDGSDMPKNADYYLPPIVRSLGEDVVVNKVRLQCKSVTDGRYLYTYTMDLAQDHPQGLRTDRSLDTTDYSESRKSSRAKKSSRSRKDSESTDYSVKSYHVRRPEPVSMPLPPQTTVSVHKPAPPSPSKAHRTSLTDFTIRSVEDQNSAEIRQEVTITFYLFGQTERGDYFRLRQFDAFLARSSLRRVLKVFAESTEHEFKEFLDHLYVLPGCGEHLKDATKWQKLPREHISMTIRDLLFNKQPFTDEFVLIVDLIGVHGMSPAVRRAIRKK